MKGKDKFFIIDGHGLIYRSVFRPGQPLMSPNGEPTRGTFSFTQTLLNLIENANPAYLAVAFDPPRKNTFRRKLFPEYKGNRSKKGPPEDSVFVQSNRCQEIVETLGIPILKYEGFEADDVIATLVDICASEEVECVVISRDKDLHQLIGPSCKQYDPQDELWIDETKVMDRWRVTPDRIVDIMTLSGDPTDNVPGVPGIGPATATKLILEFGTLAALLKVVESGEFKAPEKGAKKTFLTNVRRQSIRQADMELCRQLVELRRDVPITLSVGDLEFNGLDIEAVKPLFAELGFYSLLKRYAKQPGLIKEEL